ncbi:MAG TPA: RluA family pseudouridine synthase [Mariprofundaceae bacterium]|nr:RluA family pseudouridine synthase [Mariprofundaceae bacterium]
MDELTVAIDGRLAGSRLDHALAQLTSLSRSHLQQLLRDGCVLRDGRPVTKPSIRVEVDAVYHVMVPEPEGLNLEPESIDLEILFEDAHLLVVNKPPGMVVHPSHGHDSGTLVHALLHHCPDLPGINGVERPGIVHRLDKDTSGSMVIAKSEAALRGLSEMFAAHDIDRQYVSWCRGAPTWHEKRVEEPVGRHPQQRKKMGVRHDGKRAVTDVAVERRYDDDFCRLRLTLHTGRTHQIRVHLSHLHLPILGDHLYGRSFRPSGRVPEPSRTAILELPRQALHAELLGFSHPVTGEAVRCVATLPDDLAHLSDALDEGYAA